MDKIIDLHLSFMERLVEEGNVLQELEGESCLGLRVRKILSPRIIRNSGQRIVLCRIYELI